MVLEDESDINAVLETCQVVVYHPGSRWRRKQVDRTVPVQRLKEHGLEETKASINSKFAGERSRQRFFWRIDGAKDGGSATGGL